MKLECHRTTVIRALKPTNKLIINYLAWIEGGGILIAVAVVSITGSTVDYRKEVEFVKQTNDAGAKDTVSFNFSNIASSSLTVSIFERYSYLNGSILF